MFTMMDCTTQVSIASWLILWKHMEANVDLRTNKTLLRKWLILHYVFGTAVIQFPGDFFDPFREKEKSQTGSQVHSTHLSDTYCLTSHVFLRWSSLILYCTTLNASETLSHYIINPHALTSSEFIFVQIPPSNQTHKGICLNKLFP